MSQGGPNLVIFFSREGRPLRAPCLACGSDVRRRRASPDEGQTEVFCPRCEESLLVGAGPAELRRTLARAAALIRPAEKPRRSLR